MKYPRLGCKQEEFISHSSGVWKSRSKCQQGCCLVRVSPWFADGGLPYMGPYMVGAGAGSGWSAPVVPSPSY